jgi:hypothetical protein
VQTTWLEQTTAYDGSQLRAHWIYGVTGLVGDALVGFRGPCRVEVAEMADLADLSGPGIAGADMVHFVAELFDDGDLCRAVLRQRLMASTALELLWRRCPGADLRRAGDDLFVGPAKLSVSIATRSAVSTLLHLALNVTAAGTPVPAAGLEQLGVEPRAFGEELLAACSREEASMQQARCLVRAKGESSR